MWKVAVAILVGIPALYGLYVGFVVLRLRREAKRLARECARRHLEMEWSLFTLFPMDLEDPITLHVVLQRDRRRFELSVFPSSMSSYKFTNVRVEGLARGEYRLCEENSQLVEAIESAMEGTSPYR